MSSWSSCLETILSCLECLLHIFVQRLFRLPTAILRRFWLLCLFTALSPHRVIPQRICRSSSLSFSPPSFLFVADTLLRSFVELEDQRLYTLSRTTVCKYVSVKERELVTVVELMSTASWSSETCVEGVSDHSLDANRLVLFLVVGQSCAVISGLSDHLVLLSHAVFHSFLALLENQVITFV